MLVVGGIVETVLYSIGSCVIIALAIVGGAYIIQRTVTRIVTQF